MLVNFSGVEFLRTVSNWLKQDFKENRCFVFTSQTKREIRRFHVIVVQRRQRNVQKSVLQVQSSCFPNLIQLLFCRSHCHRHLRRGCLTSVLVVMMMTTTTDDDATKMTTTTKTMMMLMMMMMMMISYISQEHSRAGSNCFWKLRVHVIHYSFTHQQNSIFFFRRNGETVVIAKTSGLTGVNPAFWKNWLLSSVRLRQKVPKFRDVWRRHRVEETNQGSRCSQQIV